MNLQINYCLEFKDWIMLLIGFLLTIFWAFYIYSLRPKLKIGEIEKITEKGRSIIIIPIINISKKSVSKISLEVCVINDGTTYHLKTDLSDFAFIPPANKAEGNSNEHIRKFKAYDLNTYLHQVWDCDYESIIQKLDGTNSKIRVRVHATHSFSGLGKTFEKINKLNN